MKKAMSDSHALVLKSNDGCRKCNDITCHLNIAGSFPNTRSKPWPLFSPYFNSTAVPACTLVLQVKKSLGFPGEITAGTDSSIFTFRVDTGKNKESKGGIHEHRMFPC